jgi:NADH-quinone oxidoreductase subunit J
MTPALFSILAVIHVDELATLLPALVAGAAAVYFLLPRPQPYPWWIGALLGAVALLLAGVMILRTGAVTRQTFPETFLFYVFSAIAIVSGVLLVTQHNPARAALAFALVILSTCGLFLLLAAPFLMAATIIIYAGAIIVTFLFVLMLAQQAGLGDADARSREPLLATLTGFILLGALVYVLGLSYERNTLVAQTDELLTQTRQARAEPSPEHLATLKAALDQALNNTDYSNLASRHGLKGIRDDFENTQDKPSPEKVRRELDDLEQALLRTRNQTTWLLPHSHVGDISNLSGPRANEPPGKLRYDNQGRPHMPADNPAYLGRSLFTDYLLPVELGGFLLLVAVIGSIVIAQRRTPPERTS